jgi:hypothetical protein
MRSDHDVCRCASTKRSAQVSSRRRAGPCGPFGRNRSEYQGARGRHCGNAQNSASKPRLNCCATIPAAWKNSGSNNRIYRRILWSRSQQIDRNRHFEQITKSRSDKVIKWGLVSSVDYRPKSFKANALGFASSLIPGVSTSIRVCSSAGGSDAERGCRRLLRPAHAGPAARRRWRSLPTEPDANCPSRPRIGGGP